MTYASETSAISRTPINRFKMTLDYCANTYSVAPCTASGASGSECYNVFATCQDRTNYTKSNFVYSFSDYDAPVSGDGTRPYLMRYSPMPTVIKDTITVKTRVKVRLADEPDSDVGIDKYVADRSSVQGTFWKKLLARNPNYKSRPAEVSQGYSSLDEANYQSRFIGNLENIKIGRTSVDVEIVDLIAGLKELETPAKLDIALASALTDTATQATLNNTSDLDSTGYMFIDDEIFYWGGKDDATNRLLTLTRAQFNTVAAEHDDETKCQVVRYFAPASPYEHLKTLLLTDGGIDHKRVDSAISMEWANENDNDMFWAEDEEWHLSSFERLKQYPNPNITFSAIIRQPTDLNQLIDEIVNILDIRIWQNENQQIEVVKFTRNEPFRSYGSVTDDNNIILNSGSVNLNEGSRITRAVVYWDQDVLGDLDDPDDYKAIDLAIDTTAESANEYNDEISEKIFCRWVRRGYLPDADVDEFMELAVRRKLMLNRDASPLVNYSVELKDEGILTGDGIRLTTDERLNTDGTSVAEEPHMVVSRAHQGNKLKHTAIRLPLHRTTYIAPPDYGDTDSIATAQAVAGAGNLTKKYAVMQVKAARQIHIYSDADDSGVTFTVTGKDATGAVQVSAATTGPNIDGVVIENAGGDALRWTEVSQIAASGACSGSIEAGWYHVYSDATTEEKEYGFITNTDGYMDTINTDLGYHIW